MTYNSWVLWWYSQGFALLQLFPQKEWTSIQILPLLCALQFRIISGRTFAYIASPAMCGNTRMEFITCNGPKISREAAPMAILVTDGVGEGNLGKVTNFCCHVPPKMATSDPLSALHQLNSAQPSVVVVRRYTNTPYIPWGSSHLLYLDMSTFSGGASSTQFPLDQLCLCRLLPFSDTEVVLPQEEGEIWLKVFLHFWEALWQSSEEEHHLSNPISLSVPSLAFHPHWEEAPRQREDWAFTQPSSFYKTPIKPELSWNVSWLRKHRRWLKDMTIHGSNRPGGMRGSKHEWLSRQMPPFRRYFPRWVQLNLSSYCLGAFPSQFPFTTWADDWPSPHDRMRTSQLPHLHLSPRSHQLLVPQAV